MWHKPPAQIFFRIAIQTRASLLFGGSESLRFRRCLFHRVFSSYVRTLKFVTREKQLPPMKTIQAIVTRNIKEDPSIPEWDIWNIESVLLERVPDQARLDADPKEIHVEQISESRLDRTRTVLTLRTRGRSPLREGDTIHIKL